MKRLVSLLIVFGCVAALPAQAGIAEKAVREKIAGIDVIAYRTDVKNVVTFRGSLPAGDSFAPEQNLAIPTLTGEMLDKGTAKQDKFAIAQKLESIGAQIEFHVGGVMLEFQGKCLRKDFGLVISLLAEELRTPAFDEGEFAKVKKQLAGDLQRSLERTDLRAEQAFSEAVFPKRHPNYAAPPREFIAAIEAAKLEDVTAFYSEFYGPAEATLVAVGDLDVDAMKGDIASAFEGWKGGKRHPEFPKAALADRLREQTVMMADKPNVSVVIGEATGLTYREPDTLALRVGTAVLGRGFTGRLMSTVRDREGLTYGISATVENDAFVDGDWRIAANFAPELLAQGMASTKRELDLWYKEGITAAELEREKTALVGSFKVGLATTDGLCNALLEAVHRGYDVTWLDDYPQRIAALSLAEVNAAIRKHVHPEKMVVIRAGSVPPPTKHE